MSQFNLAFEAADRHVVLGNGDSVAWVSRTDSHSFIDLVEQSAALAGGLQRLGAYSPDEAIGLDLAPSWERLVALIALTRLGLVPAAAASVRLAADPPRLVLGDETIDWKQLIRIGQVDPIAAPNSDERDLLSLLSDADRIRINDLIAGQAVQEF